jgi:hypothetical protein
MIDTQQQQIGTLDACEQRLQQLEERTTDLEQRQDELEGYVATVVQTQKAIVEFLREVSEQAKSAQTEGDSKDE